MNFLTRFEGLCWKHAFADESTANGDSASAGEAGGDVDAEEEELQLQRKPKGGKKKKSKRDISFDLLDEDEEAAPAGGFLTQSKLLPHVPLLHPCPKCIFRDCRHQDP